MMTYRATNETGSSDSTRIAIVGGGVTGLSVALRLEKLFGEWQRPVTILLFEAANRLGGKIETRRHGALILETGAESFLARKTSGIELCRELGLEHRLCGTRSDTKQSFIFCRKKLHRLPEGMAGFVPAKFGSIASCSFLSPFGKLRMALDLVLPARRSHADESLASFTSRRFGREAYGRMIEPLLCGIYSGDGEQLSVAATYPQLRELEEKYGSLIRGLLKTRRRTETEKIYKSLFVTLPNGMSELIDTMAARLRLTSVLLSSPVVAIDKQISEFRLHLANGSIQSFDKVVLTGTSLHSGLVLAAAAPELAGELRAIPHVSTATVNLWYDANSLNHPMQGYGFVIPSNEQRFISAVTWTSSKHFGRAPTDVKSLRAYVGRDSAELDLSLSDSQIVANVCADLGRTMGIRAVPCGYIVRRWPQASPQYRLGHLDRLSRIDDLLRQWPGLFLCGASYRGVGIPDCIADGQRMADRLVASLGTLDRSK